ncbi:MAG: PilZ domain-containing protein [Candidatus Aquicultor sp.]|nr:PilZ domain-containing protein [Candidatus Aquicultor sp.]
MDELYVAINPGQVIEVSNSVGDVWSFGVKTLLAGQRLLCEILDKDRLPPREDADDLKISVTHETGIYEIPVHVIASNEANREYRFQLDNKYHVIQRRGFYRLPNPRVFVRCTINDEKVKMISAADIGGGGIGLVLEREVEIKQGTAIELEIVLPDRSTITVNGRVMRVRKEPEPNRFYLGINFVNIAKADRTKIVSYVFSHQLQRNEEDK